MNRQASEQPRRSVTTILADLRDGRDAARDELFDAVYTQLYRMARARWRGVPNGDTLQPTALVHEVYAKLVQGDRAAWECRSHFFSIASHAMQDILVRQARRHTTLKRGHGFRRVTLEQAEGLDLSSQAADVLAVNEALETLGRIDRERADVVRMKFFGGLTEEEIAEALGIARATVGRRWKSARAWLHEYLMEEES